MPYQLTTATKKILKLDKRIRGVAGGTSAGKTISILQYLIDKAQSKPGLLISIVSESLPHLKRGAIRDFLNIMREHEYFNDDRWNKTDFIYTFETGSRIEFFSVDIPSKVRGPRRSILYMNEANNCPYEAFDQLEVRTTDEILLDWNPTNEFWWYTEVMPNRDVDFLTLTYKDNEALSRSIVESIESRKHNKNWWKVYGLGQLGETEAQIYRNWKIIDDVPHEARLMRRGLDYGYSNDPTSIVDIYEYNGGYVLDEQLYRKGMSNKQIADFLNQLPFALLVPDSAEPKSNDELQSYGVQLIPAVKGAGSILHGIQYVQDLPIWITKRSTNTIKEYRNYLWKTDKDGKIINVPEGGYDHSMDAIRYALQNLKPVEEEFVDSEVNFDNGYYV